MSLRFVTDGNYIDLKSFDDVSFEYPDSDASKYEHIVARLHNTSKCIDWSLPEDTDYITFTVDERKFENIPISSIYFDDVVLSSQDGFEDAIVEMFPGLAGGSLGYSVYVAILTQAGTGSPTVTVLQNTIGDIVWSRLGPGIYYGTLTGAFDQSKTVTIPFGNWLGTASPYMPVGGIALNGYYTIYAETADTVFLNTVDDTFGNIEFSTLFGTSTLFIEIRVYP